MVRLSLINQFFLCVNIFENIAIAIKSIRMITIIAIIDATKSEVKSRILPL